MTAELIVERLSPCLLEKRGSKKAPDSFDNRLIKTILRGDSKAQSILRTSFRAWFILELANNKEIWKDVAKLDDAEVVLLAEKLQNEPAHASLDELVKHIFTGDTLVIRNRNYILAEFKNCVLPHESLYPEFPAEELRSNKRRRLGDGDPKSQEDQSQGGQERQDYGEDLSAQEERGNQPQQLSQSSNTIPPISAQIFNQIDDIVGFPSPSLPLAESLPKVFKPRMCDAIVKDDLCVVAFITLSYLSPSTVHLDVDIYRASVPDLVNELYGETVRYDEPSGWKLILQSGSEVSIESEFAFERARETGLQNFIGESVRAAVNKDPGRQMEIRRGEELTRRVSLKISSGPSSRLRITLDAAAMSPLETQLWFNIV
ncbi:hypothetical protein QQS21_011646 [Conoideocrella luteorostrata]|uniref:Uncharacterized protein n=1 Tax=Conoideocrella luteorostrata TaxID=1105319 RepID=A0AAJ0FN70_9HYPO|nr:hypothetical protein QQS21_011646 [Conoideocrella luteorostrata]